MQLDARNRISKPLILVTPLLILVIGSFLFRGWLEQGMEIDEVNRLNNLIPLFNGNAEPCNQSIFDINLFGFDIPLMYKVYISSAFIIKYLPLGLFEDYFFGLRLLHFCYFVISIIAFFLIISKYNLYIAFFSSLLMVTSPIFYPIVRIGFARSLYVFSLSLSFLCFYNFFNKPTNKGINLFLAVFILFFTANQNFYFIWIITALFITSILFYPNYYKPIVTSFKNLLTVLLAFGLGLANFIIYNVSQGFPTISTLFLKLFKLEEYNKRPISFRAARPLLDEFSIRWQCISNFFSDNFDFYLVLNLMGVVIVLLALWRIIKIKRCRDFKIYFFPFIVFLIIMGEILISPNTLFRSKYVYLAPFYELSILSSVLLFAQLFISKKYSKVFVIGIPILILALNFCTSNRIVKKTNEKGMVTFNPAFLEHNDHFSPVIFELNDYLSNHNIESDDIIFLVWGMQAQLYFLNKGNFRTNSLIYRLLDKETEKDKQKILKSFFLSYKIKSKKRINLYFPLYVNLRTDINNAFFNFVELHNGKIRLEKTFCDKNGKEILRLYKLENLCSFRKNVEVECLESLTN